MHLVFFVIDSDEKMLKYVITQQAAGFYATLESGAAAGIESTAQICETFDYSIIGFSTYGLVGY